jgi:hypothetical protein
MGQFEESRSSGAKARIYFAAFTAPFDFAQGRLKVVPFHDGFELTHYARARDLRACGMVRKGSACTGSRSSHAAGVVFQKFADTCEHSNMQVLRLRLARILAKLRSG